MEIFDLAISYVWEYDEEFVNLIEHVFQKKGIKTFLIRKYNLDEVAFLLEKKKIHFKAYLDRASDEDNSFDVITELATKRKTYLINPLPLTYSATNKALMHKKLANQRINLPKTIILNPYNKNHLLGISESQLSYVGRPFVIKPSLFSGGSQGVINKAESLEQIQQSRMSSPTEPYLVQEKIYPKKIKGRRAWFRVFWAFDTVIPTWWDDKSHIYFHVSKSEILKYNLLPLKMIVKRIAAITKLDYFSSEIAITKENIFFVIDYVNDQCDMRLKSNHKDGVPNEVVKQFVERMMHMVESL